MVGHSIGGVLATVYAGPVPDACVVNVDQPLFVAPFAELVRSVEARLRGPDFAEVWQMFSASFHTELLSTEAQQLVRTTSRPRQAVVLGYWNDVIEAPIASLTNDVDNGLAGSRTGVRYVVVAGSEPPPVYRQWLHERLPDVRLETGPTVATSRTWPTRTHSRSFSADTASW